MTDSTTLWHGTAPSDALMMRYTVGDDRETDARLLRWDVIGSLGHVEALARGRVISSRERGGMRRALRAALVAVDSGALTIGPRHEDGHSAIEFWLTDRFGGIGERVHTGRSRNDQVATALRLFLKDQVLGLHVMMTELARVLLLFARTHRTAIWPGYTHQRAAMPTSGGIWAAGLAEGILDAADAVAGFWPALDRSPLGSAAGYGVPLPLAREAAARALGFAGIDQVVTTTQGSRGVLEAQVLFWCTVAAHQCARLSSDVALFSADEFGWFRLGAAWSTGSSIMPQKRNPDLFELTRARAAALEGDLATVMAVKGRLPTGYHRDFQLLKAPVMRGIERTGEMLGVLAAALPHLEVDRDRGRAAVSGDLLATDEVMRRVRSGEAFRRAYRGVAAQVARGEPIPTVGADALLHSRSSTGSMGRVPLVALAARMRAARRWQHAERSRFDRAITRLTARST
jgi:argininosuccinate lyase